MRPPHTDTSANQKDLHKSDVTRHRQDTQRPTAHRTWCDTRPSPRARRVNQPQPLLTVQSRPPLRSDWHWCHSQTHPRSEALKNIPTSQGNVYITHRVIFIHLEIWEEDDRADHLLIFSPAQGRSAHALRTYGRLISVIWHRTRSLHYVSQRPTKTTHLSAAHQITAPDTSRSDRSITRTYSIIYLSSVWLSPEYIIEIYHTPSPVRGIWYDQTALDPEARAYLYQSVRSPHAVSICYHSSVLLLS